MILGIGAIFLGLFAVYQTRRWPRHESAETPKETPQAAPAAAAAKPEAVTIRPATTSRTLTIAFPDIDPAHPDVWGLDAPLTVTVHSQGGAEDATSALRLSKHHKGQTEEIGRVPLDSDGQARFDVAFTTRGEYDLIAEHLVDDAPVGQAVRAVRIADYRDEVVETFEDFVAWASSHYPFVDRKMTAREFVDRYADGRPGVPVAPLQRIVDLYELANYSEHPVDRPAYLEMVDAFLELEATGALEGPGES